MRDQSWEIQRGVVTLFGFGRRDVAERPHQPAVVEPVHPFEGSEFDSLEGPPWSTSVNELGLKRGLTVSARALS